MHLKVVSDLLGHSQIGITLDLYSYVTATMQAVAAEAMVGCSAARMTAGDDDGRGSSVGAGVGLGLAGVGGADVVDGQPDEDSSLVDHGALVVVPVGMLA